MSPEQVDRLLKGLTDIENSLGGHVDTKKRARKLREQLAKMPPGDGQVSFDEINEFCIQHYIDKLLK